MVSDDEFLERIVAGIQSVSSADAEVVWNEELNGRQFDVVVRFQLAGLRYLILFEVKNRGRPAQASDVEAFITKARDQNANKAVFVTRAGFQEGAIGVAKRHGVDLFTVGFEEGSPRLAANGAYIAISRGAKPPAEEIEVSLGEPRLITNITSIAFHYADGERHELPSEMSQMNYYVKKTRLGAEHLSDVVHAMPLKLVALGETAIEQKRLWPARKLSPPDDYFFPAGIVKSLELSVTGALGRPLEGNTLLEPSMFTQPVIYTNVLTGEAMRFGLDQLPLGGDELNAGAFYFIQHPLIYYYCEAVSSELATLHIVESFQNGEIITATIRVHVRNARRYIPVRDKQIINRLQKRLANFRAGVPGSGGAPIEARR